MSPEQTRGSRLDFRTDLYSLGVMIYESAVGAAPFTGSSMSIMAQHAASDPDPPRGRNPWVSEDLEALILSLLAKRPESARVPARRWPRRCGGRSTGSSGTARPRRRPGRRPGRQARSRRCRPRPSRSRRPGRVPSRPTAWVRPVGTAAVTQPSVSPSGPSSFPHAEPVSDASGDARWQPGGSRRRPPYPGPGRGRGRARPSSAVISVASSGGLMAMVGSPLVRKMLGKVLADPIQLTPEERYLSGHYLAYLLSGSRRRGLLLRRPLEPRNADRGRLLLGLTYAMMAGPTDESIRDAAALLDQRVDVRADLVADRRLQVPGLPRDPGQAQALAPDAQGHRRGQRICPEEHDRRQGRAQPWPDPPEAGGPPPYRPAADEVDDVLVERWNRVAEVWRNDPTSATRSSATPPPRPIATRPARPSGPRSSIR